LPAIQFDPATTFAGTVQPLPKVLAEACDTSSAFSRAPLLFLVIRLLVVDSF
jgi:hypothetical protein